MRMNLKSIFELSCSSRSPLFSRSKDARAQPIPTGQREDSPGARIVPEMGAPIRATTELARAVQACPPSADRLPSRPGGMSRDYWLNRIGGVVSGLLTQVQVIAAGMLTRARKANNAAATI